MEEYFPIIVALTVALVVWALAALVVNLVKNEKRKLAQRLAGTSGTTGATSAATSIVVASETAGMSVVLARNALMRALYRQLTHAYPDASLERFLVLSVSLGATAFVMLWLFMDSTLIASVGAPVGAYLPYMFVTRKKNTRQRQLALQLPEALDFLQRILRAGHSLSTGLAMMADELPQPLSEEFRRCYDQHSLGQPLEDCMREMARRIESTDFAFFVTAVLIQRQTGGDLSAVLGNISGMIRQRIRLQQYVKAKTAEGRFTGYILVAFPILMFFIASGMNPEYKRNLLNTSSGLTMLGISAGLVVLGLITIRKITTVKVEEADTMDEQTLFISCVVGAVALAGFFLSRVLMPGEGSRRVRDRLSNRAPDAGGGDAATSAVTANRAKELFQKIGTAASKPFMPETREKMSDLRKKLSKAGIYTPAAIKLVTGMKVICLVAGVVGGYCLGMLSDNLLLGLSLGGLAGYVAPTLWLNMQVKVQQKALDYGLPDSLDLMVVCVEAGLAVDAAMQRVGAELGIAHPRLSKEFEITHMETRVGLSRSEALRNLGIRTGSAPLQSLASMLIQAERFGTSIAGALRIHAESMRQNRQFKAEELAAKASVKMSFPLVLFIFPATFIILAGPSVVQMMNSAFFQ